MVLELAPYNDSKYFHTNECMTMPRVVEKCFQESQQIYAIYSAFRNSDYALLGEFHQRIPQVFISAEMKNTIHDTVYDAVCRGERAKVLWAIGIGWMRAYRAVSTLNHYRHKDLAEEVRREYPTEF